MIDSDQAAAILVLDAIASDLNGDPEVAHGRAGEVLLELVGPEVAAAYQRVVDACSWWASA